jgi:hypothetical protein
MHYYNITTYTFFPPLERIIEVLFIVRELFVAILIEVRWI